MARSSKLTASPVADRASTSESSGSNEIESGFGLLEVVQSSCREVFREGRDREWILASWNSFSR